MNKFKLFFLSVLFPILIYSQKYELGEVSVDELLEKTHKNDTSAVACKLFEIGKTYFTYKSNSGFSLVTEVNVKIKIYKKEGLEWANKVVNHSIGDVEEKVMFSKAVTYNLENGKIVKTKASSDSEFKEKINEYWGSRKLVMPNVKVGSIVEYKYELTSPYIYKMDQWKFQDKIPVNYSEFTNSIPEYLFYNTYTRGFYFIQNDSEIKQKTLSYTTNVGLASMSFNETINKYFLKDLPAIKEESYSNSMENYISSIEFELASTRFPNDGLKQFTESWESVAESINKNKYFGEELNKTEYFEEDLKRLIGNKQLNEKEKIALVFEFVKNRYVWNKNNSIYTDKGVKKAYQEKTGNVAEINFTLIAMLRKLGISASPILISTRNKPINLYPSKAAYNYVICGVEFLNDIIFLDATDKYAAMDVLPLRALNENGRIIRSTGSNANIIITPDKAATNIITIETKISEDSKLFGKITENLSKNLGLNFRIKYNEMSLDSYLDNVEKKVPGLEISNYSVKNKDKVEEPIIEEYDYVYNSDIEIVSGKMYIKPLMFFGLKENPFKEESRTLPIDFVYPFNESYNVVFEIPKGYVVEQLPKQIKLATEENELAFSYLYEVKGNTIVFNVKFDVNLALFPSDYYDVIRPVFNDVFLKMNEKIVLKKQ